MLALAVVAMFALGYLSSLAIRIHRESTFDDARVADVIIVIRARRNIAGGLRLC